MGFWGFGVEILTMTGWLKRKLYMPKKKRKLFRIRIDMFHVRLRHLFNRQTRTFMHKTQRHRDQ